METAKLFFYLKVSSVVAVFAAACVISFQHADIKKHPSTHYDERMWTGASVASYEMFFKDYMRKNYQDDVQWFLLYTNKYSQRIINAYAQQGQMMRKPEATFDVDPDAMSEAERQWFDANMWTFGWKAPAIGKYIMGANVIRNMPDSIDPEGGFYFDETANRIDNHASQSMIALARKPNAWMAALTVLLVFVLCWRYIGYWSGLAAALFLLLNASYFNVCTMAGLDAPSIFFGTLTILGFHVWIESFYRAKNNYWIAGSALATGIFFPLAVGSKLNLALLGYVMAVCVALIVYTLFKNKNTASKDTRKKQENNTASPGWLQLGWSLAIMGISTFYIFTHYNPVFKTDTLEKVKLVQQSVDDFFGVRAKSMKESFKGDMGSAFTNVVKRNFVNMHENFDKESGRFQYYGTLGSLLPFKFNFLDGALILFGLGLLVSRGWKQFRKDKTVNPALVLAIFVLITLLGNIRFMWVDWVRYHIAMYVAFAICVGAAVSGIEIRAHTYLNKKPAAESKN